MPREPKSNDRKTGFKELNVKKYDALLSGYKLTLGFLLIVIILGMIAFSQNDKVRDILAKALFLVIGTFIGRITKK